MSFTPASSPPGLSLASILQAIPVDPPARASRPRQTPPAPLPLSQHRRTLLPTDPEAVTELDLVLDFFQQASLHNPGKKLRSFIEGQIESLGLKLVIVALAEASATHKKRHVGLVKRFRSLCEEMPDRLIAREDRRIAEWEANWEKREAAYEAKRLAREEMEIIFGQIDGTKKVTMPHKAI